MIIDLSSAIVLANACAPNVAPETLLSIVAIESGFDPLIIGVNAAPPRAIKPATKDQAVRVATELLAKGASFDLGLGQINSRNLGWLGLSVRDAFDPCQNLAASARVLSDAYRRAVRQAGDEQSALQAALSIYNTGDRKSGFANGYVGRAVKAAARVVPAISARATSLPPAPHERASPDAAPQALRPIPPWDAFARAKTREPSFVFSPTSTTGVSP